MPQQRSQQQQPQQHQATQHNTFVFIGCYTQWLPWMSGGPDDFKTSQGITVCRLSTPEGKLTPVQTVNSVVNPSFLALNHQGTCLYAVSEVAEYEGINASGGIAAFAVDPITAELTLLNTQATYGIDPCHINIDHQDRCLIVTNYTTGNVAVYPLHPDGSIAPKTQLLSYEGRGPHPRQDQAHTHATYFSPDNQAVFITDLGSDRIYQYQYDATSHNVLIKTLTILDLPAGAGPRHLAFHPSGRWAYVVNELNNSVTVLTYDQVNHTLAIKQTLSTLPPTFSAANLAADLHLSHRGQFLWVSNRGHDSLALFTVNDRDGTLSLREHQRSGGKFPRHFHLTADDHFLLCANQESDSVNCFCVDPVQGRLTERFSHLPLKKPVCVISLNSGHFANQDA